MNDELHTFCMNYGRFETDSDTVAVIKVLEAAAGLYLANTGVEYDISSELYRLAFAALVLHWFDHRDAVAGEDGLPANLRPLINQLKLMQGAAV